MRFSLVLASSQLAWGAALQARQTSRNACATAARLAQTSKYDIDGSPIIDTSTAYDCMSSLPFDSSKADEFITEIKKYVQFQSTLDVLKKPPSNYPSSAVDIIAGLDKIAANDYDSHYDFDMAVANLLSTAHDGHLSIQTCSTTGIQFYRRGGGLISVSKDGLETPEIYLAWDKSALKSGSSDVSPITSINGQDVIEYLEEIAATITSQDADARWNQLFTSGAALASYPGSSLAYQGRFVYNSGFWPGADKTQLEFKNGSSIDLDTVALYTTGLQHTVTSNYGFLSLLCNPSSTQNVRRDTSPSVTKRSAPTSTAGPVGYPVPIIRDPENKLVGFNLDEETDVMFIPTFESPGNGTNGTLSLSEIASSIINNALENGRTKLIIDLSGNGGGSISRAFDLFKYFFPNEFPYSGTRFRRSDAMDSIVLGLKDTDSEGNILPFYWRNQVKPNQEEDFKTVEEFLDGGDQLDTKVSSLFANFNYTLLSTDPTYEIHGFGASAVNKTQPFKAEDVLIMTDGVCASTCTTFVNLMTNVGGVRAITFGGRPRLEPMQVMGGVRGAQSLAFDQIDTEAEAIDTQALTPDQLKLAKATVPNVNALPWYLPGGNVNLRNAYQEGDDDLPLQFAYQASDCRLFYTATSLDDPSETWSQAKAAIWGGKDCVSNSKGGKGSLEDRSKNEGANNGNGGGQNGGENKEDKKGGAAQISPGFFALSLMAFTSIILAVC
ncbi:hypothetical protein GRF29_44g1176347 [Pseudopithomyces chartarum]|uniref:Tail specific protease domain-containing protein n=1 Tax=Pseudopithomyces chartarum TaxID=1892770 RepID=A0AAN6LYN1_9PLEO|nr:hypothetical protein GRF29_44g1176347 [Pseudopithomyces chartarum]